MGKSDAVVAFALLSGGCVSSIGAAEPRDGVAPPCQPAQSHADANVSRLPKHLSDGTLPVLVSIQHEEPLRIVRHPE